MGDHAEQLGRARDANIGVMDTSVRQLSSYSSGIEPTVGTLRTVGGDTGIEGASADAAGERFAALAREVAGVADYLTTIAEAGAQATNAIVAAKAAYADLPAGELSFAERAGLTAATTVALPGIGTVTGVVAGEILSQQRERAREEKASQALNELSAAMDSIALAPPQNDSRSDFEPRTGTTTPGGGTGNGGPGVSGGWSGGASGGTSQGVNAYSPTSGGSAGLVSSSWTPGGGSTGGVVTGGSATGSGGSGGSSSGGTVGSGPIFTGGGSSGGGSGLGGGHVPGSGDGTSSDGLVGGTIPGGSGTGGGAFLGGSGSSGSGGANSLAGLGAGGLAGGLTIGGAALGGAGLNRLAAGGAGGLGGVGGLGGAGSVGGVGAATGVPLGTVGAGTSGSGLSGSTSSLVQGSQAGAAGAGASGSRTGGMTGAPMGGGGGAGAAKGTKRRGSGGLLAPDIDVEEGAERPDLGAAARAGGRDSLRSVAPVASAADDDQDDW